MSVTIFRDGKPITLTQEEIKMAYYAQEHVNLVKTAKAMTKQFVLNNENLQKCPWALDNSQIDTQLDDVYEAMAKDYEENKAYRQEHGLSDTDYGIWDKLFNDYIGPIITKNIVDRIMPEINNIADNDKKWSNLLILINNYGLSILKDMLDDMKDSKFTMRVNVSIKDILTKIYFNDLLNYYINNFILL